MLDFIAEQRIAEAVSKGELEDLPGAGQPLDLEDDKLVPEELRLAYRILKNAGYVPAELETLKEIGELEALVADRDLDAEARSRAVRKLALLRTRIEASYYSQALARLAR
jgi:hypothetical protein